MTSPGLISVRFLTQRALAKNASQNSLATSISSPPTASSNVLDKTPVEAEKAQGAPNDEPQLEHAAAEFETMPLQEHQNRMQDIVAQLHAEEERPLTWQKVLETPSMLEAIPVSPRPTSPGHPKVTRLPKGNIRTPENSSSNLIFILSLLGILLLIIGTGIFGVLISLGHQSQSSHALTLVASSNTVAIGATLELRGSNFTPNGRVGLTRDATLPIADTGGNSIIVADKDGNFSDTITITPDWQAGLHTVNAEDAKLHKLGRFSLLVTGKSTSLRPAHFSVSTTQLDFGSGDSATNSLKTITLSNGGGGQVTWQASTDQPWLLLSPDNGTFAASKNVQVTVAADRTNLNPGSYTAHVKFLTNVGTSLITAKMQVVPLDPGHDAVLQVSPAVLAFSATDGGSPPPAQVITVSNPGVKPLQWNVSSDASWLTLSPKAGTIQNSASVANSQYTAQSVNVGVNISNLLPGTYSSTITFIGQGQVMNSTQDVVVTVTITPQCSLQLTPSVLTFAGAYQQSGSITKTITVGTAQSTCSSPIQWSATSNASWLTLGNGSGTTPANPSVSVNSSGLQPGTYTSSIVFTTASGTNTLPVTFTVAQVGSPIMNVPSAPLDYTSVLGQSAPAAQSITIANSGNGALEWQASVSTSVGGNWLTIAQTSGSIPGSQSASLSVAVSALNTPGTYNGTLTITGTDASGDPIASGSQVVPVTFVVEAACAFTTSTSMLSFTGIAGQAAVTPQPLTIATSGACSNGITWNVASSSSWLTTTPASGSATLSTAGSTSIGATLTTLGAGNYSAKATVTAIDSVTQQAVGTPISVSISLTVQAPCTLQAPSASSETFSTTAGQSPSPQTFTVAVGGACSGNVTVTSSATMGSGTGWLTVTPASATLQSGGNATFTVTVVGTGLTTGSYSGSVSLAASNGGTAIASSPQSVSVSVAVSSSALLTASAGAASTHANGITTQSVNIANTGQSPLNWSATLSNAPSFISIGTSSGTLASGTNTSTGVVVDASSAPVGSYTVDVVIVGTDPATGQAVAGSPVTVPISVTVAPASMEVDNTSLSYSANTGSSPAPQSIDISNSGGGVLTWRISAPNASWLSVAPMHGRDVANATSSPVFTVDSSTLDAGTYSANVTITPSVGAPVIITVTLTVVDISPTPTPTIGITPTSVPTVGVTPTPDIEPTPTIATPTSTPDTSVSTPTPTPDAPTPTSTPDAPAPTPTATV